MSKFKSGKKLLKKLRKKLMPEMRELLVLWHVGRKPAHGYELIKHFREHHEDDMKMEANRLYPSLEKLKKSGLLMASRQSIGDKERIVYKLTPEGKKHLKSEIAQTRAALEDMQAYLDNLDKDIANY